MNQIKILLSLEMYEKICNCMQMQNTHTRPIHFINTNKKKIQNKINKSIEFSIFYLIFFFVYQFYQHFLLLSQTNFKRIFHIRYLV